MDLKIPKLGEGADSGVVVNVFVKEGDTVAKDQSVIELENEKAVASIPATQAGVVAKVYVKAGDKLSVGQRILSLQSSGAPSAAATPTPAAPPATQTAEPEPAPAETTPASVDDSPATASVAPVASPSLRRMAMELGH